MDKGGTPMARPTDYRPEFCEQVVAFCRDGWSLMAFSGHIGVCRTTISNWCEKHPEFRAACRQAKSAATLWWEGKLRNLADGQGTPRAVMFALSNLAPHDFTVQPDPAAGVTVVLNTNVGTPDSAQGAVEDHRRPALSYAVAMAGDDDAGLQPAALPTSNDGTRP